MEKHLRQTFVLSIEKYILFIHSYMVETKPIVGFKKKFEKDKISTLGSNNFK